MSGRNLAGWRAGFNGYFAVIIAFSLSGCFGLFDGGGDHIAGPYYTGWIDVHSTRYIGKRDSNDIEIEVIPAYIYAVAYNDSYIIAKQHPLIGAFPNEKIDTSTTNYFLIETKLQPGANENGIHGPLNSGEFQTLCTKLHVGSIDYKLNYPEIP